MQQFRELPATNAPSCVKEVTQDEFGGLWMQSNDGDLVMMPFSNLQRFREIILKACKYIPLAKREAAST